jgi:hypothetical protein
MIEPYGGFIEVHIATPLEVCESRDRKGLYARARAGLIKEFTGISDPYEPPIAAEVVIDTTQCTAYQAADQIIGYLQKTGFLPRRFQAVTKVAARLPQATVDMRVLNVQSPSAAESLGTTKKYKIIHNS